MAVCYTAFGAAPLISGILHDHFASGEKKGYFEVSLFLAAT